MPLPYSWNAGCGIISRFFGGVASTPPLFLERRLPYNFQVFFGGVASTPPRFLERRLWYNFQVFWRGG